VKQLEGNGKIQTYGYRRRTGAFLSVNLKEQLLSGSFEHMLDELGWQENRHKRT
jgi:hypothetical protein